jgi:uncharacterized membrane protein YhdT
MKAAQFTNHMKESDWETLAHVYIYMYTTNLYKFVVGFSLLLTTEDLTESTLTYETNCILLPVCMMAIRILLVISSHFYSYFTFKKCFHVKYLQICSVGYVLHN